MQCMTAQIVDFGAQVEVKDVPCACGLLFVATPYEVEVLSPESPLAGRRIRVWEAGHEVGPFEICVRPMGTDWARTGSPAAWDERHARDVAWWTKHCTPS
jgi:hypothetical protein